jgi:hypothetical protein
MDRKIALVGSVKLTNGDRAFGWYGRRKQKSDIVRGNVGYVPELLAKLLW